MSWRRRIGLAAAVLAPLAILLLVIAGFLIARQGGLAPLRLPSERGAPPVATDEALQRGAYLARLGNCHGCHTVRGGEAYAGGRAFPTPYGTLYSTNITPDAQTGIGDWSIEEFRHAMRHGTSRRGWLYPVFPYTSFALLEDADLDALFLHLRAQPPVRQEARENALAFPANLRGAMLAWRMFYLRPAAREELERGRYLVDGIGHCGSCHSRRGERGSLDERGYLAGGLLHGVGWYAPPLDAESLARFDAADLADYLRSGVSRQGHAYGVMAEAIATGLSSLTSDDARAMAAYLKSVPRSPLRDFDLHGAVPAAKMDAGDGAALYAEHCAACHGEDGEGDGRRWPPLRGAVAVTAPDPVNAVRMVLYGGIAPTSALEPRPHSMPPFAQRLSAQQVADLVNHVRGRWGGAVRGVAAEDVARLDGLYD